jgi:hypothetical protein
MNSLETEYNGKQQSFYPSVSRAAKRLLARGLLEKLPYKKWRLTPLGEQTATELKRLSKNGTLRPVPSQPLRGDKELT